jgi:2-polyprenyl-6-methoxyphenol hydroxylase-like FAD-dependent oxidoreductase
MKPEIEVLIVGAGPTGLVLALWLSHLGVKVRIVDKAAVPGTTSRALAVHARILEFYDQNGPIARLVRVRLVPLLLPALFSFREARRLMS